MDVCFQSSITGWLSEIVLTTHCWCQISLPTSAVTHTLTQGLRGKWEETQHAGSSYHPVHCISSDKNYFPVISWRTKCFCFQFTSLSVGQSATSGSWSPEDEWKWVDLFDFYILKTICCIAVKCATRCPEGQLLKTLVIPRLFISKPAWRQHIRILYVSMLIADVSLSAASQDY